MRRADRQKDRAFSLELMDRCTHGVLAISTGEDAPYCLPLSFVRVDDHLYFHSARDGRKVELLRSFPKVCVTFVGKDTPAFDPPVSYTTYFQSVIATGTAVEIIEREEKVMALEALCRKLLPDHIDGDTFQRALDESLSVTAVWRIDLDEISGKEKAER